MSATAEAVLTQNKLPENLIEPLANAIYKSLTTMSLEKFIPLLKSTNLYYMNSSQYDINLYFFTVTVQPTHKTNKLTFNQAIQNLSAKQITVSAVAWNLLNLNNSDITSNTSARFSFMMHLIQYAIDNNIIESVRLTGDRIFNLSSKSLISGESTKILLEKVSFKIDSLQALEKQRADIEKLDAEAKATAEKEEQADQNPCNIM